MTEDDPGTARSAIRTGALVVAAIAAAVLALYTASSTLGALGQAQGAERSIDMAAFANVLLDDLNRERSEAIYVVSAGIENPADYEARARSTNETIAILTNALLPANGPRVLDARQEATARSALGVLSGVEGLREGVRNQTIRPVDASAGYTAITDELIESMGVMLGRLSAGDDAVEPGFVAMARLDDRVGLETGLGFTGFALGGLSADLHPVFNAAIIEQGEHRLAFNEIVSAQEASLLNRTFGQTEQGNVHLARAALHASAGGSALDTSHRLAWSQHMVAKDTDLTVMRNVFVREHLQIIAQAHRDRARRTMWTGLAGLLLIALALGGVLLATRGRAGRASAPEGGPLRAGV